MPAAVIPLVLALLSPACSEDGAPQLPSVPSEYGLADAFPALSFERPVDLQDPRDDSNRLFVVEQKGVIRTFVNADTTQTSSVFLDIRTSVGADNIEMGLLGLAFDPMFATNGYFYVYYTLVNPRRSRISRFAVDSQDSSQADPTSEIVVMELPQPSGNHKGGQLLFDAAGYLYIALGDGGGANDQFGNGQNLTTPLGAILRIDVSNLPYSIPPDNPFAGNQQGIVEEIYAYGLRNPWRMSIDPSTGWLWVGDVGQDSWEEIDVIPKGGLNLGWNCWEGNSVFNTESPCDTVSNLTGPVWVYPHPTGFSVTGGHVYRGSTLDSLVGRYIYADYISGRLWALAYDGTHAENESLCDTDHHISAFGVDADGEIYLCDHAFNGATKIYRLIEIPKSD
jgi:glucose/arabinose dehydrogenase